METERELHPEGVDWESIANQLVKSGGNFNRGESVGESIANQWGKSGVENLAPGIRGHRPVSSSRDDGKVRQACIPV